MNENPASTGPFPAGPGYGPQQGAPAYPPAYFAGQHDPQQIIDNEHLRLLRIGFFISAGQNAIFIPLGLFYAAMGVMFTQLPTGPGGPPPPFMSWMFGALGTAFATVGALATGLKVLTAIRLKERRSRTLCQVAAAIACLEIPYGTALGVMTFSVLGRPSVQRLFDAER